MKKFKHILVCGLAVVASAVAVQAQTLTQDWKMTTGLPAAAEGRAGVGFEGKVYTNFKANKSIVSFDGSKTETLLTDLKRKRFWRGNRAVALASRVTARAI